MDNCECMPVVGRVSERPKLWQKAKDMLMGKKPSKTVKSSILTAAPHLVWKGGQW